MTQPTAITGFQREYRSRQMIEPSAITEKRMALNTKMDQVVREFNTQVVVADMKGAAEIKVGKFSTLEELEQAANERLQKA